MFVAQEAAPSKNEAQAKAAALTRAQALAERLCKGFTAATMFRLRAATPMPQTWNCSAGARGASCGFDGEAVCALDERRTQKGETCGE